MAIEVQSSVQSHDEAAGKFIGIIVFLLFIAIVLNAIVGMFDVFSDISIISMLLSYIEPYLPLLYFIAFVVSVGCISLIAYSRQNIERIIKEEKDKLYPDIEVVEPLFGMKETPRNPRLEKIEDSVESENPGEWRVAILEADIMLEEMLEAMGYSGDGIGERLKQIEKSDFNSLDSAWEAHKIRNPIAHEGSEFNLTEREATRVVALYKRVFDEFEYI